LKQQGFGRDDRRQETTMDRQHLTRRIVLSAVVVGLAVLAMVGSGDSALAKESRPGHGDKSIFKSSCDQHGGTFIDSPTDGLTICVWSDGSKTVCDSNGNDCTNYPPPPKKLVDSGVDVADVPLVANDPQTVAPADAPLEAIAETEITALVDSQVASAAEPGVLAAATEAPEPLTEESVATEVSAEQP